MPGVIVSLKRILTLNTQLKKIKKNLGSKNALSELERARQEWQNALSLFDEARGEALIDYAIYNLNAAEEYYLYLRNLTIKSSEKP